MPFENTKMSAARYEDYKFPPNIICHPNTSYARDPCDFFKKGTQILFACDGCKPRPHFLDLESRP